MTTARHDPTFVRFKPLPEGRAPTGSLAYTSDTFSLGTAVRCRSVQRNLNRLASIFQRSMVTARRRANRAAPKACPQSKWQMC